MAKQKVAANQGNLALEPSFFHYTYMDYQRPAVDAAVSLFSGYCHSTWASWQYQAQCNLFGGEQERLCLTIVDMPQNVGRSACQ